MKNSKPFLTIAIILIFIISFIGSEGDVIENLEIPVGAGVDFNAASKDKCYSVPLSIYLFEDDGSIKANILTGKGNNLGETRENRQLKSSKRFILGLNRIFLFDENVSRYGLNSTIDILINNSDINDRSLCAVCKGKTDDIFKYKTPGYPSSAEFIVGMIKSLKQFNFFPMQYSITDMIVRVDAEGRCLLLPYIELTNQGIKTTGLAIFKRDKMIAKTDIKEARIINILKENNVKGVLTIEKSPKEYINFYATSKRKVKFYKNGDKYHFIINLNITGSIINNQLYKKIDEDPAVLKKFEEDMKASVEKDCNSSINKIMQKYRIDVLDLGRIVASKYGRGTGTDWNEVISSSDIQVIAKVKVDTEGRGNY